MIMCKMLIFHGVASWYFGMIHGHGEFPKQTEWKLDSDSA